MAVGGLGPDVRDMAQGILLPPTSVFLDHRATPYSTFPGNPISPHLTQMFGHIDMTASDIVVSFALAMTLQKLRRRGGARAARAGSLQMTTAALPGAEPYRAPSPSSSGAGAPLMDGTRMGEGGNGPRFQGASAGPTGVGGGSPGSGAGPSPWSDSEGDWGVGFG